MKLLTPLEVAERLAVHKNTVYRWIESGKLKAYRLGGGNRGRLRIEERALDRVMEDISASP